MRQLLRHGTCCTNGPAPRSPNSVTTKHFTGIKRAPSKNKAKLAPSSAFFFSGVGSGAAQKQQESFARRIELAANPPKIPTGRIVHFFLQLHPQHSRSGLSEEHPDRPTRAPGGPCDLNLFLSSTTK